MTQQPAQDQQDKATSYPWEANYPSDVDYHAELTPKSLVSFWEESVAKNADKDIIDFLGKTYSYKDVGHMVDQFAIGLQAMGVTKGTRVGLMLPNSPYSVICYFGILRAGGVVVNFNPLYAERELLHQIKDSNTEMMVTIDLKLVYDKLEAILQESGLKKAIVCRLQDALPFPKNFLFPLLKGKEKADIPNSPKHVFFKDVLKMDGQLTKYDVDPINDTAVLQYTGGTTGLPKGAMLSHANLTINAQQSELWFGDIDTEQEVMLSILPFFHVFAMTVCMNMSICFGAKMIMLPRFDLEDVLKLIPKKRPTLFPAVPTIYTAINDHPNVSDYDLSSIRSCMSGGAPLPVDVKQKFESLTGCKVIEGYGLTESSPVAVGNPFHGDNKPGSIGLPVPGTVVEIVSLDDGETVMGVGEKGEICLSGPQIMQGYLNNPDATAETLRNGRLHTGDVAYMDEDGHTFIVDRIKDMILCSGFNVYPRNIEEAIYLHEAVSECIVIGVPDEYRGQTVKVFIKLAEGAELDAATLKAFLKDKLSPIEMPKQVEFRDELPKTMIGKLSRKELVEEEKQKLEAAKAVEAEEAEA